MAATGCSCCLKVTVFLANIILFLIGSAMLAIGIWMLCYAQKFDEVITHQIPEDIVFMTGSDETTIKIVGIIGIVAGGFLMIASILGCIGSLAELVSLIGLNFAMLLLLFCGVLFLIFFVFLFGEEVKLVYGFNFFREKDYEAKVKSVMEEEIAKQTEDGLLRRAHDRYDCCGMYDIPSGICNITYPPRDQCKAAMANCDYGCLDPVVRTMKRMSFGIGIACLVTGGILIIGLFLSICLCCSLRRGSYDDAE